MLAGRVLNATQAAAGITEAVVDATVSLVGTGVSTQTDAEGRFRLQDVPAGGQVLSIDSATADLAASGAALASFRTTIELTGHIVNRRERAITLPEIDAAGTAQVDPDSTTVVNNEALGVSLTVPAGTAVTEDGAPFTGELSISRVPRGFTPANLPEVLDPGLLVTVQPVGVSFTQPVPITFPNIDNLPAGAMLDILSLDPGTGEFASVGRARVSADATRVETVEGGLRQAGWHFEFGPPDVGDDGAKQCPIQGGSSICLVSGGLGIQVSTPAYRSVGQSRATRLVYDNHRASPRLAVAATGRLDRFVATPNLVRAGASLGGVSTPSYHLDPGTLGRGQFEAVAFSLTYAAVTATSVGLEATSKAAARTKASVAIRANTARLPGGLRSGLVPFELRLTNIYDNSEFGDTHSGQIPLVNWQDSVYGAGWMIEDLWRVHEADDGDVLVVRANDEPIVFRWDADTGAFMGPPDEFSTLARESTGFAWTDKRGLTRHFDADGRQSAKIDRNGNTTRYQYSGERLTAIVDPVGETTSFDYRSQRLHSITDPAGRTTTFTHDARGNLIQVTFPDDTTRRFGYTGTRLITKTDERGHATAYTYDGLGRITNVALPDDAERDFRARDSGALTGNATGRSDDPLPARAREQRFAITLDARGNRTERHFNDAGHLIRIEDAIGRVTEIERDAAGNPIETTRPNGSVVRRSFDERGNLLSELEEFNRAEIQRTYDAHSLVTSRTDARGNTTTIERDENGNATKIVNALGHTTTMEYNERGQLVRREGPNGLETVLIYNDQGLVAERTEIAVDAPKRARTMRFEYTAFGEPARVTSPTGTVQELTYDADGRPTEIVDDLEQTVVMEYDPTGNLVLTETRATNGTLVTIQRQAYDEQNRLIEQRRPHTDQQDAITQFAYDGEGNQTEVVDPNGHITLREYDAIDRLVRETDAVGNSTEFGYDARSQLTQVVTPNQAKTTFEFDPLARQNAEHSPDRGTITQEHDLADNVIASTDARGIKRSMKYDSLDRLTSVTFTEAGEDIDFTYDSCQNGSGRLCQIHDESGTLDYEYDGFGNIIRTTRTELGVTYSTEYEYDLEDRLTAIVYPSGRRVEYDRDILGRVTDVRAEVSGSIEPIVTDIEYRADGQITAARFGNGLKESRAYDLQGRLTKQTLTDIANVIIDERAYEYDPTGDITARTGTPGDQRYDYDAPGPPRRPGYCRRVGILDL